VRAEARGLGISCHAVGDCKEHTGPETSVVGPGEDRRAEKAVMGERGVGWARGRGRGRRCGRRGGRGRGRGGGGREEADGSSGGRRTGAGGAAGYGRGCAQEHMSACIY
jgi:hypothetical protein